MSQEAIQSISLIICPYHVGIKEYRVGAGPHRILSHGLIDRLKTLGYSVTASEIPSVDTFEGEIGRSVELLRRISVAISSAIKAHSFPIILAGNCNSSVGVAAGLSESTSNPGLEEEFDVVWFDAHADLDSPDECLSGYFDGGGVSMLSGESWQAMVDTIPGYRPVPLERVIFCGVRDLSDSQNAKLKKSPARVIYGGTTTNNNSEPIDYAAGLRDALDAQSPTRRSCLIHIDLDSLDPSIGRVNEYAAPGGLSESDLLRCLEVVSRERRPLALTVASFNPSLEGAEGVADVAVNAVSRLMLLVRTEEWFEARLAI